MDEVQEAIETKIEEQKQAERAYRERFRSLAAAPDEEGVGNGRS